MVSVIYVCISLLLISSGSCDTRQMIDVRLDRGSFGSLLRASSRFGEKVLEIQIPKMSSHFLTLFMAKVGGENGVEVQIYRLPLNGLTEP